MHAQAGLLIAETEFAMQVESDIAPYKGLLMGLFFMTVGMEISAGLFFAKLRTVLAAIAILLIGKARAHRRWLGMCACVSGVRTCVSAEWMPVKTGWRCFFGSAGRTCVSQDVTDVSKLGDCRGPVSCSGERRWVLKAR